MNRVTVLILVSLVLGISALFVYRAVEARRPRGTDVEQLQRMLFEGEAAAERHDAAGVNRFISKNYRDGLGLSDGAVRYEIAAYLRRQREIDLTIPGNSVVIGLDPGGRTGTVRFQLQARLAREGERSASDLELTLRVAKEPVRIFGVFPAEEWKVITAEGYGALD